MESLTSQTQALSTSSTSASEAKPTRRSYTGSCHCGAIKYILFLTLPAPPSTTSSGSPPHQRFYRCNCTTCHKAGFFHIRTPNAPSDFFLLSPLDPLNALGDYTCFDRALHWLFCTTCGVRCFTFMGQGEVDEVDLAEKGVPLGIQEGIPGYEKGKKVKVWHAKGKEDEKWVDKRRAGEYLSVNAYTLDAGQEGLDLREWTEKKWVAYLDCWEEKAEQRFEAPHVGGAY
jgi:hypothetical protein